MIAAITPVAPAAIAATKGGRIRIVLALHLLTTLLAVLVGLLPFPSPDARWQIAAAPFQLEGATHIGPQEVTLPHNWLMREPDGTAGFYTLQVDPAALGPVGENRAIFIPRFTARVDILVNGRRIATSGDAPGIETVARNTSMLAIVPVSVWQPSGNLVQIRVETRGILSGFLDRIYIGPESALRPTHERRTAIFISLPTALAFVSVFLACVLLLRWLRNADAGAYAILALALLLSAIHALNLIPSSPLYSAPVHRALHVMPVLEAPLTAIAIALMLGQRLGHPLLYLVPGAGLFLLGAFGNFQLFTIGMVTVGLPMIGFFLGLIVWLSASAAIREGSRTGLLLSLAGTTTLLFWLHDLLVVTNILADSRILLARSFYPMITSVLGALLIIRLTVSGNGGQMMQRRAPRR